MSEALADAETQAELDEDASLLCETLGDPLAEAHAEEVPLPDDVELEIAVTEELPLVVVLPEAVALALDEALPEPLPLAEDEVVPVAVALSLKLPVAVPEPLPELEPDEEAVELTEGDEEAVPEEVEDAEELPDEV